MLSRTIVVLDAATPAPAPMPDSERQLLETVRATGMTVEEADTLDAFASALRSRRARVGVVSFEALWPDPQRTLRALRDKAPGARLVVVYSERTPRKRLGQRLWSVGLCDYFVARSTPPHELTPVLRQAYADALIEGSLEPGDTDGDPGMGRLYSRIRFLHNVNAALTNQRRVEALVRELQMKLPQLMDCSVLEVMIASTHEPDLYVFQSHPMEHDVVWQLADKICTAVAPFTDQTLTPETLHFVETSPPVREDGDVAFGQGASELTIPMVFCGELVGGIGLLTTSEVSAETRAILQLVAYQLAASVRNAQALEAAESASLVDELTGTYNRRYLRRALPAEWRRANRYRIELSVVILDIDHFKRVNDVHGHVVGDAVLHAFASLLRQQLRDTDHLVRYGGEEFLLILPETNVRDATLVIERIRLVLARTPLFTSEQSGSVQVTMSAGVAGFPICDASSGEELIQLADEALLLAKRTGRDRVCLASGQRFDSIGLEDDFSGEEKRRFSRIRSQLPVRYIELPEFEGRVFTMSSTDVSSGGIAVQGPPQSLKKNAYALVYLGDEQKPRLSQVMWTRDTDGSARTAGLQFVGATEVGPAEPLVRRRRAVVVAQDVNTRSMIQRVMNAAQYDVHVLNSVEEVKSEPLDDVALLVLAESVLRGELGERLQTLRDTSPGMRIALINETNDRRTTLDTIRSQQAEHLVPTGTASEDTLFATLSKLLLEEYFGLKKYLLWGAETRSWTLRSSAEKAGVLDGVKAMAVNVRCHPRITDLLVSAVDEMIINALYRPEPIDESGRARRPVTVECGSDGRFLGVAVLDEHGLFCHDDLFRGIGQALENEERGLPEDATHAHLGFRIMLSTLSHLVINVDPGRCTEIIGLVDLRKTLKEYRSSVPSLGMFTNEQRNK